MQKERIVIVISCDNNYAPYTGVLATSIFDNNKDCQLEINVLTDYISDENISLMKKLESMYCQNINIINIDKTRFSHLPLDDNATHINICTYYRLIIPELFPDEEKVLYLDVDMIVRKSLKELWNTDLTGYAFAGVKDCWQFQCLCERLKYSPEEFYYCAGMLLFNLKYLREVGYNRIINDFVKENYNLILCHDQDIINGCFHGHIKSLPATWNMLGMFLGNDYAYGFFDRRSFLHYRLDPSIVHYTGQLKPWFKDSLHPFKKEWIHYYKLSPWRLKFKYKYGVKKRLIMYLKHYSKQFLGHCGFHYGDISPKL